MASRMTFWLAACLGLLLAAPATALDDPDQLVRQLYRRDSIPVSNAGVDRFFARDLARAMKKDMKSKDEVGVLDFDYRYGAQDFEVTELTFKKQAVGNGATVTASFKNFAKAEVVTYRMCIAAKGWRIADIAGASDEERWELRKMFKLPARTVC